MTINSQLPSARVCIIIRKDLDKWIAEGVKNSKFGSRSQAINLALVELRDNDKKPNSETS